MKIAIGSDHAGYELKELVKNYLINKGVNVSDLGCSSIERCDYPDYAHAVANVVESKEADLGILICGTGNGITMTANKHKGIRAALCWNAEVAALAKQHGDANILSLPARFIVDKTAIDCVETFLNSKFEGGRHEERINKININQ
jgi:ribose 5-phosphate isomerase B